MVPIARLTFLPGSEKASDPEIDQRDTIVRVKHEVRRLEIAVNDRWNLRVDVFEHIADIDGPLCCGQLIDRAAILLLTPGKSIALYESHDHVEPAARGVQEAIIDRRDGGMIEAVENFCLAFEALNRVVPDRLRPQSSR